MGYTAPRREHIVEDVARLRRERRYAYAAIVGHLFLVGLMLLAIAKIYIEAR